MTNNLNSIAKRCVYTSSLGLGRHFGKALRAAFTALLTAAFVLAPVPFYHNGTAQAAGETRTLWLHFTHTGEEKKITFRRDGKYDPDGLRQMNHILRDWRRNEPTQMDPRLFDLIWAVYQESGATSAIQVVSAYRSKTTNNSLRRRSSGVAKNSQHTLGKAMDFYIKGVPIAKLREIGLKMEVGGVGYYPGSKSPFVHMDTGRVRHWPRMTPTQLARVFPDGKTMHTSTEGRQMPRYSEALAEYNSRRTAVIQPLSRTARTLVAENATKRKRSGGLLAGLFNNDREKTKPEPEIVIAQADRAAISRSSDEGEDSDEDTAVEVRSSDRPSAKPSLLAQSSAPQVIANKGVDTAPIPSRIGRSEPDPAAQPVIAPAPPAPIAAPASAAPATVVAELATPLAPLPRALPDGLRDQFAPDQSILVAAATPAPSRRPDLAVAVAAAVVAPVAAPEKSDETLPRAVDLSETAALSRKDLNISTPDAVRNRPVHTANPQALVLNDNPSVPTIPATDRFALAYASANNPANNLPRIDSNGFDRRFGKTTTPSGNIPESVAASEAGPIRKPGELTVAERFAALELKAEQPSFSLKDLGFNSPESGVALRKSLGLIGSESEAAKQPKTGVSFAPAALVDPSESRLPTPNAAPRTGADAVAEAPVYQTSKAYGQRSLTEDTGHFSFAGEGRKMVRQLLASASLSDQHHVQFALPKPSHMPSLFVSPTRAFAGSFSNAAIKANRDQLVGDAVTITPTVDFIPSKNLRLSWIPQ